MDRLTEDQSALLRRHLTEDQGARVREFMRTSNMGFDDACFAVRYADGETDGDITCEGRPLTPAQRHRLGLGPLPRDRTRQRSGNGQAAASPSPTGSSAVPGRDRS